MVLSAVTDSSAWIESKALRGHLTSITSMIANQTPIEIIYSTIECEFGVNCIYNVEQSGDMRGSARTILDDLLLSLEAYHEYDEIDDTFYTLAELVLLMIRGGAKCSRDLISLREHPALIDRTGVVDSFQYIFKCMSVDALRFKYLHILKHTQPQYLDRSLGQLINIILINRNYCDPFDPHMIAQQYNNIFGITAPCIDGHTLLQELVQKNPILSQLTELRELYKRVIALIAAVRLISKQ
jgi:hypothetical protein